MKQYYDMLRYCFLSLFVLFCFHVTRAISPIPDPEPGEPENIRISSVILCDTVKEAHGYESVENPDIVPEDWEMIYDEYFTNSDGFYRQRYNDPVYASCYDRRKKITGGTDGKDFYFKGIFVKYPEAWLHIRQDEEDPSIYRLNNYEHFCTDPSYLTPLQRKVRTSCFRIGEEYALEGGGYAVHLFCSDLSDDSVGKSRQTFLFDEGTGMLLQTQEDYGIGHSKGIRVVRRYVRYDPDYYRAVEDFPDFPSDKIDCYLNVRFHRIGPLSVDEIAGDDRMVENDVIYNLNGLPVPDDRLTPGIYVRNGRKFLVR